MNCFFVSFRYLFKYSESSFIFRTRLGQYCGKNISVVCVGRITGRVNVEDTGGGEVLERGGGTGDLRSIMGGG